jgi:hypothetical protein
MTTLRALTTVLFTVTAMAVTPKPSAVALVSLAGGAPSPRTASRQHRERDSRSWSRDRLSTFETWRGAIWSVLSLMNDPFDDAPRSVQVKTPTTTSRFTPGTVGINIVEHDAED